MRLMAGVWLLAPLLGQRNKTSARVTAPSPQPRDHDPSPMLPTVSGES